MAQADQGRVGKPDQLNHDKLLLAIDQSVQWLGNRRMSGAIVGSLLSVSEVATEAGWTSDDGRPIIATNGLNEVVMYSPQNRQWVRFPRRGYVPVAIVKQVQEALVALRKRRVDELARSALPTKPKRGPKADVPKDDAFKIYRRVVALAKAENISLTSAAQRLSKPLGFPIAKWLSIYKAATRKDR